MAYTPNVYDSTNPLGTVDASTAAAEFRTLKGGSSVVLNRTAFVQFLNSAAANVFVNYSIPAGCMGTTRSVRLRARGYLSNGTGAGVSYTFSVNFGGTTFFTISPVLIAGAASPWQMEATFSNNGAANNQTALCEYRGYTGVGGTALGIQREVYGQFGLPAINTAVAQQIQLFIQMSVANPLAVTDLLHSHIFLE